MVAIISGSALGTYSSSVTTPGVNSAGPANNGRNGERIYINSATGNLVVQDVDERLSALGLDLTLMRTYNAQGQMNDDNGDNWRLGIHQRVHGLSGIVNTANSTVIKVFGDGSEALYRYDTTLGRYVSPQGDGAYDSMSWNATAQQWTWTGGSSRNTETYDSNGRLINARDTDGNTLTYGYTGAHLASVTDGSGQQTFLDYTGNNLTQIRVVSSGQTQTLTRYYYDSANRLRQVVLDLTPADNAVSLPDANADGYYETVNGQTYITTYTYDGSSTRIASITQSDGSAVNFTYQQLNGQHRLSTYGVVTSEGNRTTTFSYSSYNTTGGVYLQCDVTDPFTSGRVTTYQHNASGQLTSVLSPSVGGARLETRYGYDTNGNLTSVTEDPAGLNRVTTMAYDANGNLVLKRDAAGNTLSRTYSSTNQLITETQYLVRDPDGAGSGQPGTPLTIRYVYDAEEHLRFVVSADGRVTEHQYNASGQRILTRRFTGAVYDLSPLPASTPNSATPLTEAQLTSWAGAQNLTRLERIDYTYDFRGQVSTTSTWHTTTATGAGTGVAAVTRFVYDQRGQLLQTIDPRGSSTPNPANANLPYATTYTYDGLGRVLATTEWLATNGANQVTRTTAHQYDDIGNRTVTTAANGLVTTSTYNKAGELISVVQGTGQTSPGAVNYVQGNYATPAGPTNTISATFTTAQIAGNLNVVAIGFNDSTNSITSVTDSRGNVYTRAVGPTTSTGNATAAIYYARNIVGAAAGANTVTIQFSAPVMYPDIRIAEYSGLDTVNPLDVATGASGNGTAMSSGSITTTHANDLIIGTTYVAHLTSSAGTGFTQRLLTAPNSSLLEDRTVTSTGSHGASAQQNMSGWWVMQMAAFRVATPAASGRTTLYKYDVNGRLAMVTDPTGLKSFTLYDEAGRKTGEVDADGSLTEYVYNKASELIKTIRYATALSATALASLSDANGNPTNPAVSAIRPASSANDQIGRSVYNSAGQVQYTIDGAGAVTENIYDGAGRLIDKVQYATPVAIAASVGEVLPGSFTIAPDSVNDRRTRYFYNNDGQLVGTLDAAGYLSEILYDGAGHASQTIAYANATSSSQRSSGTLAQLRPATDNSTADDPERDAVSYCFYDGQGRKIGELDAEGYLTETQYDIAGNISRTLRYDPYNAPGQRRILSFTPGTTTFLTLKSEAASAPTVTTQSTTYQYDGAGRLIQEVNYENTATTYTYDNADSLISTTRAAGTSDARTNQARYDFLGRLTQELTGEGSRALAQLLASDPSATQAQIDAIWTRHGVRYAYDAASRRISATTNPNDTQTLTTYFYYDNDSRLRFEVNAAGEVIEHRYNALGQLTNTLAYTNRIATTGLAGGLLTNALATQLTPASDARDARTSYSYTLAGQVNTTTTALNATENRTVTESYTAFGEVRERLESIDAGRTRRNERTYDTRGLVIRVRTDASGLNLIESSSYDAFGRLISYTDPRVNAAGQSKSSKIEYDRLGRTIATVDILGNRRTTTYDAFDRVLTIRDALNNETTYSYTAAAPASEVSESYANLSAAANTDLRYTISVPEGATNLQFRTVAGTGDADIFVRRGSPVPSDLSVFDYFSYENDTEPVDANELVTITNPAPGTYHVLVRAWTAISGVTFSQSYMPPTSGQTTAVTVTTPEGIRAVTTHNRHGETLTIEAGGNVTRYAYDANGNVISVSDNLGTLETRVYDGTGRQIRATDARGAVTKLDYDAANRVLTRTVDPRTIIATNDNPNGLNLVTSYVYDGQGRITRVIEPNGRVTASEYDAAGRLVTLSVDPDGLNLRTRYTYDHDGRSITVTEGYGSGAPRVAQYKYDAAGRRIEDIVDPTQLGGTLNLRTQYKYDANNNLTRRIDARGNSTWYVYDDKNRLAYTVNALGEVTGTTYDIEDRVIATRIYTNKVSTAGFGDIVASISIAATATDGLTQTVYDKDGRAVYTVDTLDLRGAVTERTFNDLGQVVRTRSYARGILAATPEGTSVSYGSIAAVRSALTAAGNDIVTPDVANDRLAWNAYDARGQLAFSVDGVGAVTQYGYDGNGNVIAKAAYAVKRGLTAAMDFAALATFASAHAGNIQNQVTRYWYDTADRARFVLDAEGFITEIRYNDATRELRNIVYNAIDANGNPVKPVVGSTATLADVAAAANSVANSAYDQVTLTHSDAAGRVDYRVDAEGYRTNFFYDAVDNLIRTEQQIDKAATPTYAVVRRYYDGANRETFSLSAEGYLLENQYDAMGNVRAKIRYDQPVTAPSSGNPVPVSGDTGRVTRYAYDSLNRVTRESSELLTYSRTVSTYTVPANATWASVATAIYGSRAVAEELAVALAQPVTGTPAPGASLTPPATLVDVIHTDYQYDAHGNLTDKIEAADSNEARHTRYVYDAGGRITDTTVAYGTADAVTTHLELDAFGNATRRFDAYGTSDERRIDYTYDGNDRETSEINAAMPTVNVYTGYDAFGNATGYIMGFGSADARVEACTYDRRNAKITETNGAGEVTAYRYDAAGNMIAFSDGNAVALTQSDDAHYRDWRKRLGVTGGDGQGKLAGALTAAEKQLLTDRVTTRYSYDRNDRMVEMRDPIGVRTQYRYDGAGNQTETIEAVGLSLTDPAGGVVTQQRHTYNTYDKDNRLRTVRDPLGYVTSYEYDALDRQTRITDASNSVRTNTYDKLGRLLSSVLTGAGLTNGGGLKTAHTYDNRGNAITTTISYQNDTDARVTTYAYDRLDRLVSVTDADRFVTGYGYDKRGNQTSVINANATPLTTSDDPYYQDLRRRLLVAVLVNGVPRGKTVAELTDADRQALIARCTILSKYDAADRLTDVTNEVLSTTHYDYDAVGNRKAETLAHGSSFARAKTFTFDGANRIISVTAPLGGQTFYSYDKAGNQILERTLQSADQNADGSVKRDANGNPINAVWIENRFEYNGRGELTATIDPYGTRTEHYYDAVGNEIEIRSAAGTVDERSVWMKYDLNSRKTDDFDGYKNRTHYDYDAVGNRIKVTDALGYVGRYYFDGAGRLTGVAAPDYAAGQTAGYAVTIYTYDSSGNKIEERSYANRYTGTVSDTVVPIPSANSHDRVSNFLHSKTNRLIQRSDPDRLSPAGVPQTTYTLYAYDALGQTIGEYRYAEVATYVVPSGATWAGVADTLYGTNAAVNTNAGAVLQSLLTSRGNPATLTGGLELKNLHLVPRLSGAAVDFYLNPARLSTDARKTTFGYDAAGRLQTKTEADGTVTFYEYDAVGNRRSETATHAADPNPIRRTEYTYDLNNRVRTETFDPSGLNIVQTHGYDQVGNLTSRSVNAVMEYGSPTERWQYDLNNRQLAHFDGEGVLSGTLYDRVGNVRQTFDSLLLATDYVYDKNNRLIEQTSPQTTVYTIAQGERRARPKTTHKYDVAGHLVETVDPNGFATTYYRNSNGRVAAELNGDNVLTEYTYDVFGQVTGKKVYMTRLATAAHRPNLVSADNNRPAPPAGDVRVNSYEYDLAGRLIRTALPTITQYGIILNPNDTFGGIASSAAALSERHVYDRYGNEIETYDRGNKRTLRYFDVDGNVLAEVDPMGYVKTWTYDSQGRKLTERVHVEKLADPDALNAANPLTLPTGAVHLTEWFYDVGGRLIKEIGPEVDALPGVVLNNNWTSLTTSRVRPVTAFTYDQAGNVLTKTWSALPVEGTNPDLIENREYYYYDRASRRIGLITNDIVGLGAANSSRTVQSFSYDTSGNLKAETRYYGTLPPGFDLAQERRFQGVLIPAIKGSANYSEEQSTQHGMLYDELGRVRQESQQSLSTALGTINGPIALKTHQYDAAGNRTHQIDEVSSHDTRFETRLDYDAMGHVRESIVDSDAVSHTVYEYDAAGNLTRAYLGKSSANNAVAATNFRASITPPSTNVSVSWDVAAEGQQTWVVYDTVSRSGSDLSVYAQRTPVQMSNGTSLSAVLPTAAAGTTYFFRIVTQDASGNRTWTGEQKITVPSQLTSVSLGRPDGNSISVTARFFGSPTSATIKYGTPGNLNQTATLQLQSGSNYIATIPAADPAALAYQVTWTDASGATYATAQAGFTTPTGTLYANGLTTNVTQSAVTANGVTTYDVTLVSQVPQNYADSFMLMEARWRLAGSNDVYGVIGAGAESTANGSSTYRLRLQDANRLPAGTYEIVLNGARPDGSRVGLGTFLLTTGAGATTNYSVSWQAPAVGNDQLVIVNGQRVTSVRVDDRVVIDAQSIPAGGSSVVTQNHPNLSTTGYIDYEIDVPAGATNLTFSMSGGSGNAQLYAGLSLGVGQGINWGDPTSWYTQPTDTNNETITVAGPRAGLWHVTIDARGGVAGMNFTYSYVLPGGGGGSASYTTYYGQRAATPNTVRVTSSSTSGTTNLGVQVTLSSAEAGAIPSGNTLRVKWRPAGAGDAFPPANDIDMPATATSGVYSRTLNSLAAGQYDLKVYYIDGSGREVIVQWSRVSTSAATTALNGYSTTVLATESGAVSRKGPVAVTSGSATVPAATNVSGKIDGSLNVTWTAASGVRTYIVWDTVSRTSISAYANRTTTQTGTGAALSVNLGSAAVGTTYYFRAVTEDANGNRTWGAEQKVTTPSRVTSVVLGRPSASQMSVTVRFDGPIAGATLRYGTPGNLNSSKAFTSANGAYTVTVDGVSDPTNFAYQVTWSDGTTTYASGEARGAYGTSTTQATGIATVVTSAQAFVSNGVTYYSTTFLSEVPSSMAGSFSSVQLRWRPTNTSTFSTPITTNAESTSNGITLYRTRPHELGNYFAYGPYVVQLLGVLPDGRTVALGSYTVFIDGITTVCQSLSWQAASVGDEAIAVLGGRRVPVTQIGDRLAIDATAAPNSNSDYAIYYGQTFGSGNNATVAFTTTGSTVSLKVDAAMGTAEVAGLGPASLRLAYRAAGTGSYSEITLTKQSGQSVYSTTLNNLAAGEYDLKVYYTDSQGREVIIQWTRASSAQGTTYLFEIAKTVLAKEVGSLTRSGTVRETPAPRAATNIGAYRDLNGSVSVTWSLPDTGNTWVVYDTFSRASSGIESYANKSTVQLLGGGSNAAATLGTLGTYYFRVVTQDGAGNITWTAEQKTGAMPQPEAVSFSKGTSSVTVNVRFDSAVTTPKISYYSNGTWFTLTLSGQGTSYTGNFTGLTHPDSFLGTLMYYITWRDSTGVENRSANGYAYWPAGDPKVAGTLTTVTPTASGSNYSVALRTAVPKNLVTNEGFTALRLEWRTAGSTGGFQSSNVSAESSDSNWTYYRHTRTLASGSYEFRLLGVRANGSMMAVGNFTALINNTTVRNYTSGSWQAPPAGTDQLLIFNGAPLDSAQIGDRIAAGHGVSQSALNVPYYVYYGTRVANTHTLNVSGSVQSLAIKATFNTAESIVFGNTLRMAWRSVGTSDTFNAAQIVSGSNGVYNHTFTVPGTGAYDIKIFYYDAMGREVIVEWQRVATGQIDLPALTYTFTGRSLIVYGAERGTWVGNPNGAAQPSIFSYWGPVSVIPLRDLVYLPLTPAGSSGSTTTTFIVPAIAAYTGEVYLPRLTLPTPTATSTASGQPGGFTTASGYYTGAVDLASLLSGLSLTPTGTGVAGGGATTDGRSTGYYIEWRYNALDDVIGSNQGDGLWRDYYVDASGNRVATLLRMGIVDFSLYDKRNRQTAYFQAEVTAPDGTRQRPIDRYGYDVFDNVTSHTDANKNVWKYEYNVQGNLIKEVKPRRLPNQGYDEFTKYYYDAFGRQTAIDGPSGGVTRKTYDIVTGNLSVERNGAGDFTGYRYDYFNRLAAKTDGRGMEMLMTDNAAAMAHRASLGVANTSYRDLTVAQRAFLSQAYTTRYVYDYRDNLALEMQAQGWHLAFDNDPFYVAERNRLGYRNNPLTQEDRQRLIREFTISYNYDAHSNRVGRKHEFQLSGSTYDALGHVTSTSVWTQHWQFAQVPEIDLGDLGYFPGFDTFVEKFGELTTTYEYDAYGNRIAEIHPDGLVKSWTYGAFGRLLYEYDEDGNMTGYEYDQNGRMFHEYSRLGKDIWRTYDELGRVLTIEDRATGVSTRYTYDLMGNRLTEVVTTPGNAHNRNVKYTYDALGQLTRWSDSVTGMHLNMEYDADGNLEHVYTNNASDNAAGKPNGDGSGISYDPTGANAGGANPYYRYVDYEYEYDDANRVLKKKRVIRTPSAGISREVLEEYTYDAAGNRLTERQTSHSTWEYKFDANNRVVRGAVAAGEIAGWTKEWDYDIYGNVVRSFESLSSSDPNRSIWTTTEYTIDGLARTVHSHEAKSDGGAWSYSDTTSYFKYDGRRRLVMTEMATGLNPSSNAPKLHYFYKYDGAGREQVVGVKGALPEVGYAASSRSRYDVNGMRISIDRDRGKGMSRNDLTTLVYDNEGHILYKDHDDGKNTTHQTREYVYANGNPGGEIGFDPYLDTLNKKVVTFHTDPLRDLNRTFPGANTTYTVRSGDTLRSIADAVYGNGSLWYIIADANGLGPDQALPEGALLRIPNTVQLGSITTDTHAIYSEADIVGSTLPLHKLKLLPKVAQNQRCLAITAIVVTAILAVIISAVTYGAAAAAGAAMTAAVTSAVGTGTGLAVGTITAAAVGSAIATAGAVVMRTVSWGLNRAGGAKGGWWSDDMKKGLIEASISGAFSGAVAGFGGGLNYVAREGMGFAPRAPEFSNTLVRTAKGVQPILSAGGAYLPSVISNKGAEWQRKDWIPRNVTGIITAAVGGFAGAEGALNGQVLVSRTGTESTGYVQAKSLQLESLGKLLAKDQGFPLANVNNLVGLASPWMGLAETRIRNQFDDDPYNDRVRPVAWANAVSQNLGTIAGSTMLRSLPNETYADTVEATVMRGLPTLGVGVVLAAFDPTGGGDTREYFRGMLGSLSGGIGGTWIGNKIRKSLGDAQNSRLQKQELRRLRRDVATWDSPTRLRPSLRVPGEFNLQLNPEFMPLDELPGPRLHQGYPGQFELDPDLFERIDSPPRGVYRTQQMRGVVLGDVWEQADLSAIVGQESLPYLTGQELPFIVDRSHIIQIDPIIIEGDPDAAGPLKRPKPKLDMNEGPSREWNVHLGEPGEFDLHLDPSLFLPIPPPRVPQADDDEVPRLPLQSFSAPGGGASQMLAMANLTFGAMNALHSMGKSVADVARSFASGAVDSASDGIATAADVAQYVANAPVSYYHDAKQMMNAMMIGARGWRGDLHAASESVRDRTSEWQPNYISDSGQRLASGESPLTVLGPQLIAQTRVGGVVMAGATLLQATREEWDWKKAAYTGGAVLGGLAVGAAATHGIKKMLAAKAYGQAAAEYPSGSRVFGLLPANAGPSYYFGNEFTLLNMPYALRDGIPGVSAPRAFADVSSDMSSGFKLRYAPGTPDTYLNWRVTGDMKSAGSISALDPELRARGVTGRALTYSAFKHLVERNNGRALTRFEFLFTKDLEEGDIQLGTNFEVFSRLRAQGLNKDAAAMRTPSGKALRELGLTKVMVYEDPTDARWGVGGVFTTPTPDGPFPTFRPFQFEQNWLSIEQINRLAGLKK